jgi:hypothetical protein
MLHLPEHPGASKHGYVMEHRVVAEQTIGRRLTPGEVVHHKNGIKDDNRPENLEVMPKRQHDRHPKRKPTERPCPECGRTIGIHGGWTGAEAVALVSLNAPG